MGLFNKMLQSTTDRLLYAVGSQEAAGRLNLGAATNVLRQQWGRYAGRKSIREPAIRHISHFLEMEYGLELDDEELCQLVRVESPNEIVAMDVALPRIANVLLDSGVMVVNRD